jgi:hypothetical protein
MMRRSEAQRTSSTLSGISRMIGFALSAMLVLALVWVATAHAQRPTADQYEKLKLSTAPSGPALGTSGVSVGEAETGGEPRGRANPGDPDGGKSRLTGLKVGVLPATGGPMLLIICVGVAATGAGLVLLRLSGRGR